MPLRHVPDQLQLSLAVHGLPSEQALPPGSVNVVQPGPKTLQATPVQSSGFGSVHTSTLVGLVHTPAWHVVPSVQGSPSEQEVPSATFEPPPHVPAMQVVPIVQGLPSEHAPPSFEGGFEHEPPTHWSAVQGLPSTQSHQPPQAIARASRPVGGSSGSTSRSAHAAAATIVRMTTTLARQLRTEATCYDEATARLKRSARR